jgi:hypothetical protein
MWTDATMTEATSPRVEFDTDLDGWTIDLEPPGPAGIATLEISSRLQLLVDVAEPGRIGAILSSDAPGHRLDAEESSAVEAIFGRAVLDDLPGRRAGGRARRRPTSPGELAGVRDQLARLALAEDLAIDTTDEAVAAVAGAEAALLTETLRDDRNLAISRPASTTSAAGRLISEYPSIHERLTAPTRDELADLMLGLAPFTTRTIAAQLRSISEDVTRRDVSRDAEVAAWHPHEAPVGRVTFSETGPSGNVGHVRLDRRLFSPTLLDPSSLAEVTWHRSDGDLVVRCRVARGAYLAGLGTHWARAYRPESRTVLALAPLEPIQPSDDAQWAAARLHLGDQDPSTLAVDVTDAPQQCPPSVLRRTIEEANQVGSDAACLERSDAPEAIDAWETCANTWRAAGDADREAIALARAANVARTFGQETGGAALHARLARLTVTWAADRLDPTQAPRPFVADLLLCGTTGFSQ